MSVPSAVDGAGASFPLQDVVVLDLGQYISGPCAAVLLAEMGATVIKIEPPAGDPFRKWEVTGGFSASFVAFNRGKKSVVLDLKTDAGRAELLQLASTADVLIENFRPGITNKLGIDYASLVEANPKLIYCTITGFSSDGPFTDLPAYDGVAAGYSGLASLLTDTADPRVIGPALADAITGHSAAFAVSLALLNRASTGRGQHLDISMVGAVSHFLHSAVSRHIVEGSDDGPYTRAYGSQSYAFRARDGKGLITHLSSPEKFWLGLCNAVGRPELSADERFRRRADRLKNYDLLRAELQPIFATKDRAEWLDLLAEHGVPCAPIYSIGEALGSPQLEHLGIIDSEEISGIGPLPRIRPPVRFDGNVLEAVTRPPFLGEHDSLVTDHADANGT